MPVDGSQCRPAEPRRPRPDLTSALGWEARQAVPL